LVKINDFIENKLSLKLHPQKINIRKFRRSIDFLGYIILPHYVVLRTKTKRRMFKKIKQNFKKYQNGLISQQSFNQSLQSYLGILNHCSGYKIKETIDKLGVTPRL